MTVDPLQPHRPVGHDGVDVGGGGEAAETPFLLVPAAPDDPAGAGIRGGISGDLRLRFLQCVGVREIEGEGCEAEAHDMAVSIRSEEHPSELPSLMRYSY